MNVESAKISFLDRNEKNNVNFYLNNNYHLFNSNYGRYQFSENSNFYNKITQNIINILEQYEQQIGVSIRTVFVYSLDRNSKLLKINDEFILILDLHQIFEYVEPIYLSQIINANSVNNYVSIQKKLKEIVKNKKYDIQEELVNNLSFHASEILVSPDICAPIFLNNLADILFNYGYVDASIVCLNSILNIDKSLVYNDFNKSLLFNNITYKSILTNIISAFIVSHEINHLLVKIDEGKIIEERYCDTLVTIDFINRFDIFLDIWRHYSLHIKYIIDLRQDQLYKTIKSCGFGSNLQSTLERELNKLFETWLNISFEEYSPDFYEELFCDINALNMMLSSTKDMHMITSDISDIIYMLMAQETHNIQKSIVNIILGQTDEFSFVNIKRIQFIFSNLFFQKISKHLPTEIKSCCALNELTLSDTELNDMITGIIEQLCVMFENYYIAAIYNSIRFFKNDVIHNEINAVHFCNSNKKSFVFTDCVNNPSVSDGCRISPIDFIVMQESFVNAYLKYRRYVYKNNIKQGD